MVEKIETVQSYAVGEAVDKKYLAKEVCEKCPMLETCTPKGDLTREEISHLRQLQEMFVPGTEKKYVVQVYGFNAGDSMCLLTKKDSPIEFKQL